MLIIHHICVVDQFVEYSLQLFPPFCERRNFFFQICPSSPTKIVMYVVRNPFKLTGCLNLTPKAMCIPP